MPNQSLLIRQCQTHFNLEKPPNFGDQLAKVFTILMTICTKQNVLRTRTILEKDQNSGKEISLRMMRDRRINRYSHAIKFLVIRFYFYFTTRPICIPRNRSCQLRRINGIDYDKTLNQCNILSSDLENSLSRVHGCSGEDNHIKESGTCIFKNCYFLLIDVFILGRI